MTAFERSMMDDAIASEIMADAIAWDASHPADDVELWRTDGRLVHIGDYATVGEAMRAANAAGPGRYSLITTEDGEIEFAMV